ncbi:YncE family protein [Flavobacterium ponti]|uniref:YncE family protein n=1 Tax=Flavobacterium ponti TaxID=665133 RepID=A0ABV9P7L8_9FLAO
MIAAIAVFFASCSDDDNQQINNDLPLGAYDNGVLILNEGNFGQDNSTISFLSNDLADFQVSAFSTVNPTKILGNTAQDIGFYDDYAFVVVNASNKIEIVNRYTLEYVATVDTGLDNPRYIAFANGKGYVTNWGDASVTTDDYVAILNVSNYTVSGTIPVVEGPERIIENNGKLYVAHKGGYGYGNTVSVISSTSNSVTNSIALGADVPNSLQIENGSLYVICGGKPDWTADETLGKFIKINLSSETVTSSIDFTAGNHPSNLVIDGNEVYYTVDLGIYKMNLTATSLPSTELFSTNSQGVYGVYSFAVANDKIFVGDALDYSANGKVYIYSKTGNLEKELTVGVTPTGFYFN